MKKSSKILIAALISIPFFAPASVSAEKKQEKDSTTTVTAQQTTRYYLEMRQSATPTRGQAPAVSIICGDQLSRQTGLTTADLGKFVISRRIGSLVDALNYLTDYGWTLQQTYTVAERGQTIIHWILAKDTRHPMDVLDGLVEGKR